MVPSCTGPPTDRVLEIDMDAYYRTWNRSMVINGMPHGSGRRSFIACRIMRQHSPRSLQN